MDEIRTPVPVSFEFFPPNTPVGSEKLRGVVAELAVTKPEFFSVTYGAGGSTRERTHDIVRRLAHETTLKPAAHLTCVDASRADRKIARGAERIPARARWLGRSWCVWSWWWRSRPRR